MNIMELKNVNAAAAVTHTMSNGNGNEDVGGFRPTPKITEFEYVCSKCETEDAITIYNGSLLCKVCLRFEKQKNYDVK
jgi:hypothetical protein